MNRAHAALVLSLLLSGTRTVGAEPCAPRAQLEGDPDLIERVASELQKLGVTIAGATTTSCPSLEARVELDSDGGIVVAVRSAAHRSESRVVSDAALAAIWIDSWVRDDLDVSTWPGPTTIPGPASAQLTPPSTATRRDVTPAHQAASWLARSSLSAAYELAQTSDDSSFSGFGVAGCMHVGALCVGGRIRAGFEAQLTTGLTAAARSDMSALVTASAPLTVGEMTIAPEAGLGVGRFSTRRLEGCEPGSMPPNCDPTTDPSCVMDPAGDNGACTPDPSGTIPGAGKLYIGDGFDHATFTPRVSLALRVAVPLIKHVWLDGFAGVELMPLAHTNPFVPTTTKSMIPPEEAKLPGEPTYSGRLGIGIRVGAP